MNFQERKTELEKELTDLITKYEIDIYAANVMMPNGEVIPALKMVDKHEYSEEELKEAQEDATKEKKDEDKTKK